MEDKESIVNPQGRLAAGALHNYRRYTTSESIFKYKSLADGKISFVVVFNSLSFPFEPCPNTGWRRIAAGTFKTEQVAFLAC